MSDTLVFTPHPDSPTLPNPWLRLPPGLAVLVAPPMNWGTVQSPQAASPQALWQQIATATQADALQVTPPSGEPHSPPLPALAPSEQTLPAWLAQLIDSVETALPSPSRSKTDLIALQAGLLQLGDFLTPSHEHSQSIEGRGNHHAGDYWHAINHRREPDYGNAKYWFRHVGNHPLLADIAAIVPDLASEFPPEVQSRSCSLMEAGRLNPFHFVDLVSDACRRNDRELIRFAERLQWIEMVGLLEWTLRDVTT